MKARNMTVISVAKCALCQKYKWRWFKNKFIFQKVKNYKNCQYHDGFMLKMNDLLLLKALLVCYISVTYEESVCDFEESHQWYVIGIYSACYNEANRT